MKSAFSSPGTPNIRVTPSISRHFTNTSEAFIGSSLRRPRSPDFPGLRGLNRLRNASQSNCTGVVCGSFFAIPLCSRNSDDKSLSLAGLGPAMTQSSASRTDKFEPGVALRPRSFGLSPRNLGQNSQLLAIEGRTDRRGKAQRWVIKASIPTRRAAADLSRWERDPGPTPNKISCTGVGNIICSKNGTNKHKNWVPPA